MQMTSLNNSMYREYKTSLHTALFYNSKKSPVQDNKYIY